MGSQIVDHIPGIGTVVRHTVQTADEERCHEMGRIEILTVVHLQRLQFLDVPRQGIEGIGDVPLAVKLSGEAFRGDGDELYWQVIGPDLLDGQAAVGLGEG